MRVSRRDIVQKSSWISGHFDTKILCIKRPDIVFLSDCFGTNVPRYTLEKIQNNLEHKDFI